MTGRTLDALMVPVGAIIHIEPHDVLGHHIGRRLDAEVTARTLIPEPRMGIAPRVTAVCLHWRPVYPGASPGESGITAWEPGQPVLLIGGKGAS